MTNFQALARQLRHKQRLWRNHALPCKVCFSYAWCSGGLASQIVQLIATSNESAGMLMGPLVSLG